eukprot:9522344-Alexandrium_andersonii.AAC.1
MRTCLGHTCPWVTLERVGRMATPEVLRDLALRQRSDVPLGYFLAPECIMQEYVPDRGGVTDREIR